ncbi:hypothetical protein ROZALSC1DRAFT_31369 [Rozella allomycis CSF55]|uniref:Uncharacterized protein n=1 Tax=Rozella allomycis (strain CSF55) TaxID=988480 RepID=A0A4P9YCD1_ROZAC|nr:hypothetical protein ROZALSC1DRAFT_31369 [Rozella allomycis CSF55]
MKQYLKEFVQIHAVFLVAKTSSKNLKDGKHLTRSQHGSVPRRVGKSPLNIKGNVVIKGFENFALWDEFKAKSVEKLSENLADNLMIIENYSPDESSADLSQSFLLEKTEDAFYAEINDEYYDDRCLYNVSECVGESSDESSSSPLKAKLSVFGRILTFFNNAITENTILFLNDKPYSDLVTNVNVQRTNLIIREITRNFEGLDESDLITFIRTLECPPKFSFTYSNKEGFIVIFLLIDL